MGWKKIGYFLLISGSSLVFGNRAYAMEGERNDSSSQEKIYTVDRIRVHPIPSGYWCARIDFPGLGHPMEEYIPHCFKITSWNLSYPFIISTHDQKFYLENLTFENDREAIITPALSYEMCAEQSKNNVKGKKDNIFQEFLEGKLPVDTYQMEITFRSHQEAFKNLEHNGNTSPLCQVTFSKSDLTDSTSF